MAGKRITIGMIEEFFVDELDGERVFRSLERADFVILHCIKKLSEESEDGRVYLKELGTAMGVTMPELSRMINSIQDKGYVLWKTSEDKTRTYVQLTSRANRKIEKEQEDMREVFNKIKRVIPHDELEITLATVRKISEVIREKG